jgi:HAD superfamily hydrolase (TIGR01549 family)
VSNDLQPSGTTDGRNERQAAPNSTEPGAVVSDNRRVEAIVFDMDGTLFDSATVVPDAYIDTVVECGGAKVDRAAVVAAYPLGPPATILTHLLGRACHDEEVASYHERLRAFAGGVAIYPGLVDALAKLTERLPLGVSTGASARAAEILLSAAGLSRFFDVIVGGDEVAQPKPAPDGVRLACERLGVPPRDVAYIGDADVDLEAARRAGAVAIAAGWGHLYRDGHDAVLVLREPAELVRLLGP